MESDLSRTRDELTVELFELREKEQQPYLSEERKAQIRRRIAVVAFELGYPDELSTS